MEENTNQEIVQEEIKEEPKKTKINWKVRFKNKIWVTAFLSLIIGFIFDLLAILDIAPSVTQSQVTSIVSKILEFMGLFGVIVDPTTAGLGDSNRALGYAEPWNDNINN